jgi:putative redox protein
VTFPSAGATDSATTGGWWRGTGPVSFLAVFTVETRTVAGQVTALGSAGSFTLVVDRPVEAGGGGKGFNGGQLLYLAVAGCISNDLFREAPRFGVELHSVRVTVEGDFSSDPAVSEAITYDVELSGSGDLDTLVREVDRIAEIPNTLRQGTPVSLRTITTV